MKKSTEKARYENLSKERGFGEYKDPFAQRRMAGAPVPKEPVLSVPFCPEEAKEGELVLTWLGHSSCLLQFGGQNILLDPVFCKYASPFSFAGPRRFPGAEIEAERLPRIDVLIVSHNHYDHLDLRTLRKIKDRIGKVVTPLDNKRIIAKAGIPEASVTELGWGDCAELSGIRISCQPAQHFSQRWLHDGNRSLWGSFVIEVMGKKVFYSGDGGYSPHFASIGEAFGPFDLALLECGQYNIRWHSHHMFPEESVQAGLDLGTRLAVPVHNGAYNLSDHFYREPAARFETRAKEVGLPFLIPVIGKRFKI